MREGSSLTDALAVHPDIFSDLYVGMVRAGETAGALEAVLDRLAEYSEQQAEFISKVRGALTYPIIMMVVGIGYHGLSGHLRGPADRDIFQQQHAALPTMTRVMISSPAFLTTYWLLLLM